MRKTQAKEDHREACSRQREKPAYYALIPEGKYTFAMERSGVMSLTKGSNLASPSGEQRNVFPGMMQCERYGTNLKDSCQKCFTPIKSSL